MVIVQCVVCKYLNTFFLENGLGYVDIVDILLVAWDRCQIKIEISNNPILDTFYSLTLKYIHKQLISSDNVNVVVK